jgi:hypothetical protein
MANIEKKTEPVESEKEQVIKFESIDDYGIWMGRGAFTKCIKALKGADDVMITDKEFTLILDYPFMSELEIPFKFYSESGFTRKILAILVKQKLLKIYTEAGLDDKMPILEQENETAFKPATDHPHYNKSGMGNGAYGIFHELRYLTLIDATYNKEKKELTISLDS